MQVRVLGAVAVTDRDGHEAARLERKARELLTVLALRAPATVGLDEMADLLWDDPPPSAVKTIRSHISRLRTALESADVDGAIERGSIGYRLTLADGSSDLDTVTDHRRRARELLADGRADDAASLLADARRIWRGDPELPDSTTAAALLHAWQRERRQLVEEHLHCIVEGSDPGSALGELELLTATDPLDEPLSVLHVQALHRTGRQTEAIRALGTARDALADIGLEPGAALRRAERELYAVPDDAAGNTAGQTSDASGPALDLQIEYASGARGHVAYTVLSEGRRDMVVLNPGMITIDGLMEEPHARSALARLGEHARVICFDRRGIGLSDPLAPRTEPLDEWVEDVAQVFDALHLRDAHVLANFDTGLVAIEYAARYPDRIASLILIQCYPRYSRSADYAHGLDPTTTAHLIKDAVDPATPADRIDTAVLVAPSLGGDPTFRSWWTRIGQRAAGPETATTIRTVATSADVRHRLGAITAPTLVVHRRNCLNVDIGHSQYLATHIDGAQLEITPGTDSLWFTDTPDVLDRAITFLSVVAPS